MSVDSFSVFLKGHDVSFSPAEIERELASMWKPVSERVESGSHGGVSRVVLGSLLWIGSERAMERVLSTIRKLVPKYPCRLFLLEYREGQPGAEVKAAVNAQCFLPKPGAQPVCCEVIHLTFGPEGARHVRGSVTPLLIGELQTVLWDNLAEDRPEGVKALAAEAEEMIHQASRWREPARALEALLASDIPAFDLSWFRLASIREQLITFFDDPHAGFRLDAIRQVRVQVSHHGPESRLPEVMGALLVGWLGSRLGWEAAPPKRSGFRYKAGAEHVLVKFDALPRDGGDLQTQLSRIDIETREGDRFHLALSHCGDGMDLWCGEETDGSPIRRLVLSELGEAEALGLALNASKDPKGFRAAARLAIPLLEYFHSPEEAT